MGRRYDLAVFGATGFTGRQAARYLAAHPERESYRFALAARSQEKLEALVAELTGDGLSADGVIVADALDGEAMDGLAAAARVVLSTAGPFARYGSELVRACVEHRTDYVDITGETPWVREMIDRHHERAARDGTRIVPCCGFDSIPSDLGALYVAEALHRETGARCSRVHAYHRGRGGINGGTVASLVEMQRGGGARRMRDLFLLNPEDRRPRSQSGHGDPVAPFYSSEAKSWAAPFFMGPINTRVVRRSHALLQGTERGDLFADDFRYQEYWKAKGPLGFAEAGAFAFGQGMAQLGSALPGASRLIEAVAADPGEGPSEATMDGGFFSCDLYAEGDPPPGAGAGRARRHSRLHGQGDPGNRITIKCLCESALLLALEREQLPSSPGGGVLTPATALGLALVPLLQRPGIDFG